jgi:ribosomal protein S1
MTERRDDGGDGGEDFAAMLEEFEKAQPSEPRRRPRPGDTVKGRVVAIGGERVFVDLGGRDRSGR